MINSEAIQFYRQNGWLVVDDVLTAAQLAEARRVALAQQVAWALPAKDVARRVSPRRAAVVAVTGEEVEEQPRLTERPGNARREHARPHSRGSSPHYGGNSGGCARTRYT